MVRVVSDLSKDNLSGNLIHGSIACADDFSFNT